MENKTLENILTLLQDYEGNHSDFQIGQYIVGQGGATTWGKYKQALRELARRVRNLKTLDLEKQKLAMQQEELSESIAETEREARRFLEIASGMKAYLGNIDDAKRAKLEAAEWVERTRIMIGIDCRAEGHISRASLEMLLALPREQQAALLQDTRIHEIEG